MRDREAEVRDDRVRTALQGDEEFERITVLLPRGAEDARHDVLGAGAQRGAVAATRDDGGPDGLLGLPVRHLDIRAGHAGEERRPRVEQAVPPRRRPLN